MLGSLHKAPSTSNSEIIATGCNDLFWLGSACQQTIHTSTVCRSGKACLGGIAAVALLEEHHLPTRLPGILQPRAAVWGLASNERQRHVCRRQALHHVQNQHSMGMAHVARCRTDTSECLCDSV